MKRLTGWTGLAGLALILSLPLAAQERGGRDTPGNSAGGTASIANRGIAASPSSPAPSAPVSVSRDSYGGGSYAGAAPSSTVSITPNLRGTSFSSVNTYYSSLDFYSWVHARYFLDGYYFRRFYINTEPLITPRLAQVTLRQPLNLSRRMLTTIDELEQLILDSQAGKPVSKQEIDARAQEIRDLARKLRQDPSLNYFDQRKEKDLLKGTSYDELGLEAVSQLREMALDLNRQLRNLYEQKSTATISVEALSAPSFTSLSRGIERLSKVISNSARRVS